MLELEDVILMTKKRAYERGYLLRENMLLLGILHREDAEPLCMMYDSIEKVLEFIREMNPSSVTLESAVNEDCTQLRALLCDHISDTVH